MTFELNFERVSVYVPKDSAQVYERAIDKSFRSRIDINYANPKSSLDIFIGSSEFTEDMKNNKKKSCFVMTEPPEILLYESNFLDNFDYIIGPSFEYLSGRQNLIINNPILPYFVGIDFPIRNRLIKMAELALPLRIKKPLPIVKYSISELIELEMHKTKSVSVIISSKVMTNQQINRIKFVQFMERNSKIPLRIHGGLTKSVSDKFEILSKSTHHIAIENSSHNDYWTEKLADSILALNYTFYSGAPNIHEYFDKTILGDLSLSDFKAAQHNIEEIFFTQTVDLDLLRSEREKLLNDYSLLGLIEKVSKVI